MTWDCRWASGDGEERGIHSYRGANLLPHARRVKSPLKNIASIDYSGNRLKIGIEIPILPAAGAKSRHARVGLANADAQIPTKVCEPSVRQSDHQRIGSHSRSRFLAILLYWRGYLAIHFIVNMGYRLSKRPLIRITLFRGNGVLDVTVDKFSARFSNAVGEKDLETIKDCVAISLSTLAEWLPTMTYREHVIRGAAFLSLLSDSSTAADDFLNNLMGNKMMFRGEDIGASKSHFGLKAEFENPGEKWIVSFDVSRSWISGDMLIVNSSAIYQGDSAMKKPG
jgi:hypothetical protein